MNEHSWAKLIFLIIKLLFEKQYWPNALLAKCNILSSLKKISFYKNFNLESTLKSLLLLLIWIIMKIDEKLYQIWWSCVGVHWYSVRICCSGTAIINYYNFCMSLVHDFQLIWLPFGQSVYPFLIKAAIRMSLIAHHRNQLHQISCSGLCSID